MIESACAAFLVGLLGAGHCFGMCGGITAALAFAIESEAKKRLILLAYNLGRILSYAMIGALAGFLGAGVVKGTMQFTDVPVLRFLAALMLILMGFYLTGWWKVLVHLERFGAALWKYIQPLGQRLMPVKSSSQALFVGMLWGWLPCGLVYSALVYAGSSANPLHSSLVMLAFGLGTFPAVFAGGLAGGTLKKLLQRRAVQMISGLALMAFGAWTAYIPYLHSQHANHGAVHGHSESSVHPVSEHKARMDEAPDSQVNHDSHMQHSHPEADSQNNGDSRREKQHENSHHH